jgi:hypothetical protein
LERHGRRLRTPEPDTGHQTDKTGCEDCLKTGDQWVLSSACPVGTWAVATPRRTSTRRSILTPRAPLIRSVEPGELGVVLRRSGGGRRDLTRASRDQPGGGARAGTWICGIFFMQLACDVAETRQHSRDARRQAVPYKSSSQAWQRPRGVSARRSPELRKRASATPRPRRIRPRLGVRRSGARSPLVQLFLPSRSPARL